VLLLAAGTIDNSTLLDYYDSDNVTLPLDEFEGDYVSFQPYPVTPPNRPPPPAVQPYTPLFDPNDFTNRATNNNNNDFTNARP